MTQRKVWNDSRVKRFLLLQVFEVLPTRDECFALSKHALQSVPASEFAALANLRGWLQLPHRMIITEPLQAMRRFG